MIWYPKRGNEFGKVTQFVEFYHVNDFKMT